MRGGDMRLLPRWLVEVVTVVFVVWGCRQTATERRRGAVVASVAVSGFGDDGSGGVAVVRGMVMVVLVAVGQQPERRGREKAMLANNLKVLPMLNAPDQTSDPRKGGDCSGSVGGDVGVVGVDDGGVGGCCCGRRRGGSGDGDGSGVMMVVVLWWAAVGRQPEERAARAATTTVKVAVERDVVAEVDAGIDMEVDVGVDVEDKVEDEFESSVRGTMEVGVDVTAGIDILDAMLIPDVVERLEHVEEGLQDFYDHNMTITRSGPCTVRCGKCKKVGHLTRDCKAADCTTSNQRGQVVNHRVFTCFECGRQGQYKSDCPKLKDQNRGNKTGNKNGVGEARGKAYVLGVDRSFVSTTLSTLLDITPDTLDVSYVVDVGVNIEDEVEDEVESRDRGTMEVGVDVVAGIDIPDAMLMPDAVKRLELVVEGLHDIYDHVIEIPLQRIEDIETGQRELEARGLIAGGERVSLLDQVASLERSNARLRGTMMMERTRADRFRRRNITITHSGITPEAIKELINRRVEEALAAYEATRAANAIEAKSQSQNGSDDDNEMVEMEMVEMEMVEIEMVEMEMMETEIQMRIIGVLGLLLENIHTKTS
ncbi:putative reverse transcriptase domain-containing protein [Tanacetum coccineum]